MTETKIFRLTKTYIKALDQMCEERGYKSRTEAIEIAIIRSYMTTHTDGDWNEILNNVYREESK